MTRPKAMVSWSSGKDSAYALHVARREGALDVVGLFTTVTRDFERVAMHGTREAILDLQAEAAGLPLLKAFIPYPCSNETYEAAMRELIARMQAQGVTHLIFGDLYLQDIREYREAKLAGTGMEPVFPLWNRPTRALAQEMLAAGLETVIVCVDPAKVDPAWAGKRWDAAFLDALPEGVDPCAEAGEFHTCVVGGPMFSRPIAHRMGEVVTRDGFCFADVLPGS